MEEAVSFYFSLGLSNSEILFCLAQFNGIVISIRTLKRIQKKRGLFRRVKHSDVLDIALFLVSKIETSAKLLGYRMMHLTCIQHGFVVTQETIRLLMNILSPHDMDVRRRRPLRRRTYRSKGPNFLWHMDSYDKLKPYGICINGAIDGFSRYIIWLEANRTSSDPSVIASYFMEQVSKRKGCPTRMRADKGTENTHVRDMMNFMRHEHGDEYANSSFIVGSSNHNQRIEQWWGYLRKMNAQYWMNLFGMMKDMDIFSGDFLDKSLIQFCFMDLIQGELCGVMKLWNTHRIRGSRRFTLPQGKPLIMYYCCELYGVDDCLIDVPENKINACLQQCVTRGPYDCDQTVSELCDLLMEETNRCKPETPEQAVVLYEFLREQIHQGLHY